MTGVRPGSWPAAAALLIALMAVTGAAQTEGRYAELSNFHRVNERLYRGAQPKEGGVRRLKALGIETIINLRGPNDLTRAEAAEAQALGIHYYNIPLDGVGRPSDAHINQALALIDAARGPVFVHCKHGEDRTGTLIAVYRISHDRWTAEEAIAEARRYGMSWIQFGMRDYIRDYARRREQPAAAAQPPQPRSRLRRALPSPSF
jgi:protein tyrosine/serine phosphatase